MQVNRAGEGWEAKTTQPLVGNHMRHTDKITTVVEKVSRKIATRTMVLRFWRSRDRAPDRCNTQTACRCPPLLCPPPPTAVWADGAVGSQHCVNHWKRWSRSEEKPVWSAYRQCYVSAHLLARSLSHARIYSTNQPNHPRTLHAPICV